VTITEATK